MLRPYAVVVPKFTWIVEPFGTVTAYEATKGLFVVLTAPDWKLDDEKNETGAGLEVTPSIVSFTVICTGALGAVVGAVYIPPAMVPVDAEPPTLPFTIQTGF